MVFILRYFLNLTILEVHSPISFRLIESQFVFERGLKDGCRLSVLPSYVVMPAGEKPAVIRILGISIAKEILRCALASVMM